MFKGITEDDREIYDTRDEAVYRANMLAAWSKEPSHVFVEREWVPTWLQWARDLFRGTPLQILFYERMK